MSQKLSIILLSTLITACSSGTVGGLLPAPKILHGKLEGLTYTSPQGDLTITAPATEDHGEWTYTQVKEHTENTPDQMDTYVGFKTPYDSHLYSAEVVNYKHLPPLTDKQFLRFKNDNLKRVINATEERWGSKVERLNETSIHCANNQSFAYTILKQKITSYELNFVKYYLISLSYQGSSVAIVTSELNFDLRNERPPEADIKNAKYTKHRAFTCSLKYGAATH
ncbi:hypothetical protein [Vibrio gazogenes]|uniref:Lipoprotein n=1 Tax=Vibrio gazogenes DSM 21264 = NBRC 103151 TaxID=1123492 RepID=A0A1M5F667_VIBGA|nr:hypothetical protein [Vibrio gazogenes]USP15424.1 hypothetical protein MKS89_18655 [Vibrio gazogenes]SHF86965.1 hypothetical protein SAMN02745781_03361 [Vibrio gazogenes DSM 21264] [Vibrio gazogenes DSM 21264 = NBRC 103151]SJN56300.1 hypothetical protein BQ6471_01974 [Vibrio gazogenes]